MPESSRRRCLGALHEAFDERHESDYEAVRTATLEEAAELLAGAERFVERVAEYLGRPPEV